MDPDTYWKTITVPKLLEMLEDDEFEEELEICDKKLETAQIEYDNSVARHAQLKEKLTTMIEKEDEKIREAQKMKKLYQKCMDDFPRQIQKNANVLAHAKKVWNEERGMIHKKFGKENLVTKRATITDGDVEPSTEEDQESECDDDDDDDEEEDDDCYEEEDEESECPEEDHDEDEEVECDEDQESGCDDVDDEEEDQDQEDQESECNDDYDSDDEEEESGCDDEEEEEDQESESDSSGSVMVVTTVTLSERVDQSRARAVEEGRFIDLVEEEEEEEEET